MSLNNSDTPNIDKKKNLSDYEKTKTDNIAFIKIIVLIVIDVVLHFIFGSFILYICKLSQSNILPTDINCYPYTENKSEIEKIISNIFESNTDPKQSLKIDFDVNEKSNSRFVLLDSLREMKKKPKISSFVMYFIEIFQSVFSVNYSLINGIFNIINNFPEWVSVVIIPFLLPFIFIFLYIVNWLNLCYSWIVNMSWFFKKNTNDSDDKNAKPNWQNKTFADPFDYGFAIFTVIILFMLLMFFSASFFIFFSLFITIWCLLSCISYKSNYNGKLVTGFAIIKDVFKYYKVFIMRMLSVSIILDAFAYLGVSQGIFALIIILLINFNIIPIGIFTPIIPENLSAFIDNYDQAIKYCVVKEQSNKKSVLNYFSGGGSKNITKELKKFNKLLKKNKSLKNKK